MDQSPPSILRAALDGSDVAVVVDDGLIQPFGIAVHPLAQRLYWTDWGNGSIRSSTFDGSDLQVLIQQPGQKPAGLALDPLRGKIYWTDVDGDRIQRANLDGSAVEVVVSAGLDVSAGMALDPYNAKLYWTDAALLRIRRANLDGSEIEDIINSDISNPVGIALDLVSGKMYWTDVGTDRIQRANLDGSDIEDITPLKIQSAQGTMQRATLNGHSAVAVLQEETNEPLGIAVARADSGFVIGSQPVPDSIDARQPHGVQRGDPAGWNVVNVMMNSTAGWTLNDFLVESDPAGSAPQIVSQEASGNTIQITLHRPIPAGAWTTIVHRPSGTRVRLGFLPGDVNGDRVVSPNDVLTLLDDINGAVSRPRHSTDINRSGLTEPLDVLRLLDLLNGAGAFEPWNGRSLP